MSFSVGIVGCTGAVGVVVVVVVLDDLIVRKCALQKWWGSLCWC